MRRVGVTDGGVEEARPAPRLSSPRRALAAARRRPGLLVGLALIVLLAAIALAAPWLAPHDPTHIFDEGLTDSGGPLPLGAARFPLGTDPEGRDVLSRLVWSTRTSLAIGLVAVALTAGLGAALGAVAGFFGGWADTLIMRGADLLLAFPPILLAMALVAAFGSGLPTIVAVVAAVTWPPLTRLVYVQVLSVRERDFVEAARALGVGPWRLLWRHVAPQTLPLVTSYSALAVAAAVSLEATLSFLGLGVPLDGVSWGVMINIGGDYYRSDPPLLLLPAVAIVVCVLAFTLVGEDLRGQTGWRGSP